MTDKTTNGAESNMTGGALLPEASPATKGQCNTERACSACYSGQGPCENLPYAALPDGIVYTSAAQDVLEEWFEEIGIDLDVDDAKRLFDKMTAASHGQAPAGATPVTIFGHAFEYVSKDKLPHPDDVAVDRFAAAMKEKLALARAKGRGGWDHPECTQQRLSGMLREHVEKGDPRDVANFCMFLWSRGEAVAPTAQAAPAADHSDNFWPVDGKASRNQLIKQIGQMNFRLTALRQENAGLIKRIQGQAKALRNNQGAAPAAQADSGVQEGAADPLQGAANWLNDALVNCNVRDIQHHLFIGYNRAKRLYDAALAAKGKAP